MSVDNLPARRNSAALAVPAGEPQTSEVAPQPHRLSSDLLLTAFVGAILTGSATWSHMTYQAIGIGAGTAAVAAAGLIERRREHRT